MRDDDRDGRADNAHHQRHLCALDDARIEVTAHFIGTEEMPRLDRREALGEHLAHHAPVDLFDRPARKERPAEGRTPTTLSSTIGLTSAARLRTKAAGRRPSYIERPFLRHYAVSAA